jgi:hypothetical protein
MCGDPACLVGNDSAIQTETAPPGRLCRQVDCCHREREVGGVLQRSALPLTIGWRARRRDRF